MQLLKLQGLPKLILIVGLSLLMLSPAIAKAPDATVKIAKLEEALTMIQRFGLATQPSGGFNPVSQVTAMLQGTDWIDPRRSIVIGITFENKQPQATALIPYILPNEAFQKQMGAKKGADYYALVLPPKPGQKVDRGMERALAAESQKPPKAMVTADLFVDRLIAQFRPQIQEGLQKLEQLPMTPKDGSTPPPPFDGQDISKLAQNMLGFASQLNLLSLMLDADSEEATISIGLEAKPKTQLATLFSGKINQYHLSQYAPKHQVNFSSLGYDIETMMNIFQSLAGDIYTKMGIDFSEFNELLAYFEGESAGGITMTPDGMSMEAIAVLNDKAVTDQFLEKVYVPWLKKYAVTMAKMIEKNTGQKVDIPIVVNASGKVQDLPVYEVQMKSPAGMGNSEEMQNMAAMFGYNMRMIQVDRFLVMAENDQRLSQLITIVRNHKLQKVERPLMVIDIDMGSYMKSLSSMLPQKPGMPPMPSIRGTLRITSDMQKGQATSVVSIPMSMFEDIAKLSGQKTTRPTMATKTIGKKPVSRAMRQISAPMPAKPKLDETHAVYWLQKGLLSSTYGSPKGALRHYGRALKIDPRNVHALFQSGVAQAELGQYDTALELINRAISESQKKSGDHFYGRGWVYFLSGHTDLAMQDFRFAALQGDQDAIAFLNRRY